MTERQAALKDRIGDLMELLDVLLDKGIARVAFEGGGNDGQSYSIHGTVDILAGMASQVVTSDNDEISGFEEAFNDERRQVLKIVARLAETATSMPWEENLTA